MADDSTSRRGPTPQSAADGVFESLLGHVKGRFKSYDIHKLSTMLVNSKVHKGIKKNR